MSRRMWVGIAIAALVAAVLTIPAAGSGNIAASTNFSGNSDTASINVYCAAAAPTGSPSVSSIKVWVTSGGGGTTGASSSNRVIATWQQGASSATLNNFGSSSSNYGTISAVGSFPCPGGTGGGDGDTSSGTIAFQPQTCSTGCGAEKNWANGGTPPTATSITYNRVLCPSGPGCP